MMKVEECYWISVKSVQLYGKIFIPDGKISAIVIMVHGIGEHSGCYDEWAQRFVFQSVGFVVFDLRGHGHSPGVRGHAAIRWIRDDIRMIIKNVRDRFSSIPVVLFGHSMGGNIVLNFLVEENIEFQGVIASSPWLKLVLPPSSVLVWVAKWASYIVPWLTVPTGIKADQLSNDEVRVKSTKTDPFLHKKISIKLFSDLWKSSEMLLNNEHRLNIPLLLMHATADPLTSFQATESFAQNAGGNITFKEWHEMRHDLLNDAGNEVVFQYVIKWLSNQIIKKWNSSEQ